MAWRRVSFVVAAALAAGALGGCGKTVQLTFVNLTGDSMDVNVTSPRHGRQYVGLVAPMGKISHELTFDKKELPVTCRWSAGGFSQTLTVTGTTASEVMIDIQAIGRPEVHGSRKSLEEELKGELSPAPTE